MTKSLRATAFAMVLLAAAGAGVARAQEAGPPAVRPNSGADALLQAAIAQLVEALGQALRDAPHYALPQMNENGDIILRRLNPPTSERPAERTPGLRAAPGLSVGEAAT